MPHAGWAALARAVLLTATDGPTADALAPRFAGVVRQLPHSGGVVRAASVRAWVARTTPGRAS